MKLLDSQMKNKAQKIIDGWSNWINRDPDVEYIATIRATICADCDKNKYNICIQCGCPLASKTRSTDEKCPLDKWPTAVFINQLKITKKDNLIENTLNYLYEHLKTPRNTFTSFLKKNLYDDATEDNN